MPALARPISGRARVARTLVAWSKLGARIGGLSIEPVEVNGRPGALTRAPDDGVLNAMSLEIADGQIQAVRSIVNPDKLAHLGRTADLGALLERVRER